MPKKIIDTSNKNHLKKNAVYILLLISNVALFIGLIGYYSKVGVSIKVEHFDEISAVIATIIILGFISSKLPKIKNIGESSLYGMAYFVIICAIGLMTSYFNGKVDTASYFGPFLEMFKILCGVLIFVLLATNLQSFKNILYGEHTRKDQAIILAIFIVIGLFASYAHVTVNGTPANIRCLIVMISGMFGGPVMGIPVGIISGAYRYTLGGVTGLPCAISTVLSGVIGSLIFIWNDKKFPGLLESMIAMFLFTGFEMLIVVIMTPADISFPFVRDIYPIMAFASVTGMLIFSIVIKEARERQNPEPNYVEEKIKEFENKLEDHVTRNEELKDEIQNLKNEIKELKE